MVGRGMALFAVLSALILASAPASAAKRVALVIGNDKYDTLPPLNNAATDARGMAEKLRGLGFDVILKLNASHRGMVRALAEFEGQASAADVGLVYYAGHGIQADGANYLIPSNAQIEVEVDLRSEGMDSRDFLTAMKNAGTHLNIVILDACRDNPLPKRGRSAARGLMVTAAPSGIKGTAVMYSAAPGQTAQDGPKGGNGVFTGALLAALDRPGLKLEEVFKQTAIQVASLTNNQQKPWINSSITGDFVFNLAAPARLVAPPVPYGARPSGGSAELLFWESIKDSNNPSVFKAYLSQYPDGSFATLARLKLDEFASKQAGSLAASIALEPIEATYVAVRNANVRAAPDAGAAKVETLRQGSEIYVPGKVAAKNWLAVDRNGKRLGYVFAKLLQDKDPFDAAKAEQARIKAEAVAREVEAGRQREAAIIPPKVTAPRPVKPVVGIYPGR
ncbi:MAG: caspase family protein, partial [Proteobacteria bacterium]|nr:caspase family protein [Pseudomonadota bacterium]